MASIELGGATVSVEDTAQATHEGRPVFEWIIVLPSGVRHSATDLCGALMGPEPTEEEMLNTLFVFLGAAAESRQYRERGGREIIDRDSNESMFPAPVVDWASENSDEISILGADPE